MSKNRKIALLFPGQGAQYPGMMKDFVENFAVAKETFEEADDRLGRKLSAIILQGPLQTLTETRNSQTAIFVACVALLRVLQQQFPNFQPTVCAGLSLGEYTALYATGRILFADCLELVQWRGQYMNDACEMTPGKMAVVLGLEADVVEKLVRDLNLRQDLWVANFNCPGQVAISGTERGIEAATAEAKTRGAKRILPLQVHGAFHSGLMKIAEERLAEKIEQVPLQNSEVGFVMNVPGDYTEGLLEIRSNLIAQVTQSVRWEQGIRAIGARGIDLFLEIGPGKALAGFNKRIGEKAPTFSIETVQDLEQFSKGT